MKFSLFVTASLSAHILASPIRSRSNTGGDMEVPRNNSTNTGGVSNAAADTKKQAPKLKFNLEEAYQAGEAAADDVATSSDSKTKSSGNKSEEDTSAGDDDTEDDSSEDDSSDDGSNSQKRATAETAADTPAQPAGEGEKEASAPAKPAPPAVKVDENNKATPKSNADFNNNHKETLDVLIGSLGGSKSGGGQGTTAKNPLASIIGGAGVA